MVRAALDRASRCAAVICDCVLQEPASAVRGNIAPATVKSNKRVRGKVAGLRNMAAAFRGDRPAGKSKSFAGLLIFDAKKLNFVHSTDKELAGVFAMGGKALAKYRASICSC